MIKLLWGKNFLSEG